MTACCTEREYSVLSPVVANDAGTANDAGDGGDAASMVGTDAALNCQAACIHTIECVGGSEVIGCTQESAGIRCFIRSLDCHARPEFFASCGRRFDAIGGCERIDGRHDDNGIVAVLARMAALEAESAPAFERLACELAAHGAPDDLVHRARRAASDERRHARVMDRLVARFGGASVTRDYGAASTRGLEAIAIENVVEGCVRELFGALVAEYQARHAGDPAVRAAMRAIARDEAAHAWLAMDVDAWLTSQLDDDAVLRIEAARRDAVEALAAEVPSVANEVLRTVGLPDASVHRAMVAHARRAVWS